MLGQVAEKAGAVLAEDAVVDAVGLVVGLAVDGMVGLVADGRIGTVVAAVKVAEAGIGMVAVVEVALRGVEEEVLVVVEAGEGVLAGMALGLSRSIFRVDLFADTGSLNGYLYG